MGRALAWLRCGIIKEPRKWVHDSRNLSTVSDDWRSTMFQSPISSIVDGLSSTTTGGVVPPHDTRLLLSRQPRGSRHPAHIYTETAAPIVFAPAQAPSGRWLSAVAFADAPDSG